MATNNERLAEYRRYKSGDNPVTKFVSTVAYTLSFGFAFFIAYQHCLGEPVLSGWAALIIMTVLPQLGLANLYYAFRR